MLTFNFKKIFALFLISTLLFSFCFFPQQTKAAYSLDDAAGTYTDDFADTSGISSSSNVEISSGALVLTKTGGNYNSSGYAILDDIVPQSVAEWGTLNIVSTTTPGTSIAVQVYDDANVLYSDTYLPENSTGVTSFPVDLSSVPPLQCASANGGCNKAQKLRLKFTLTSSDVAATPSIDSLSLTWTVTQGDLTTQTISTDAWPADFADRKLTSRSPYSNGQTYPAIRWVNSDYTGNAYVDRLYALSNKIFGWTSTNDYKMFALDRSTGSSLWSIPFSRGSGPYGFISANGTFYGTEMGVDLAYAIDTSSGAIKWSYNFVSGHGNSYMALGNDGTIYTIRNNSNTTNIIYNFSQDGALNWSYNLPAETGILSYPSTMSVATNGTLYFGTIVYGAGYALSNLGKLYAINPSNGNVLWSYSTGDMGTSGLSVVDSDGTIYVGNQSPGNEIKLYAINPDGTKKWEQSFGTGGVGFYQFSLADNGKLWATFGTAGYANTIVYQINTSDGSTLWSKNLTGQTLRIVADATGGVYFVDIDTSDASANIRRLNYYDANHNLKWQLSDVYNSVSGTYSVTDYMALGTPVVDENGWIYEGLSRLVVNGSWVQQVAQQYSKIFAMAPWTLTVTSNASAYSRPGDIITFTATTSMLQTNALLGGDNQMQVVMDNNDKVVLTYSSTNSGGDTVWTGSYTLPADVSDGSHTFTVEASQPYIQTDITTHFDSAPTQTNNTGITTTGTFLVDDDAPAVFNLSLPANNSRSVVSNPTFSWNASSDSGSLVAKYQLYVNNSLAEDNIVTTSTADGSFNCGANTWYVKAVDANGNLTNSDTFNYTRECGGGSLPPDAYNPPTTPDGGFFIQINDGAKETKSQNVTLTLNAGIDTKKMAISNAADFQNVPQESYQQTKQWTLTPGNGQKIVYVKFFTQYGQSSQPVSANIVLTGQTNVKVTPQPELQIKIQQIRQQLVLLINQLIKMLLEEISQIQTK